MNFLNKLYFIIENNNKKKHNYFSIFMVLLIIFNIIAIVLESIDVLKNNYKSYFYTFEFVSIVFFTIEYFLRMIVAKHKYKSSNYFIAAFKYIFSPMAIVDLLAILPFYLPMFFAIDLRFIRLLRLIRLFRIFKLNRYTKSIHLIVSVFKRKQEELLITVFITFLLLLLSSIIMYFVESEAQPKAFPNILYSFWWAITTLSTVGYGDIYPVTGAGKIISGFVVFLGIGIVALPTGIISSGFIEVLKEEKGSKNKNVVFCPKCGERIDVK